MWRECAAVRAVPRALSVHPGLKAARQAAAIAVAGPGHARWRHAAAGRRKAALVAAAHSRSDTRVQAPHPRGGVSPVSAYAWRAGQKPRSRRRSDAEKARSPETRSQRVAAVAAP